ncbi:hypothetical protein GIB67_006034 [Kingdonia uniflora]|uniref:Uncharacterized protein n=1 Tax=Kingdonia uniflora TaxID=39325 RepID=A0A7J7LK96_9MAGN|nr:hypothetical protein GIB67_041121 [Kingdonia uniflora]KAF6172791.1 hypothetical protein GIB67_006034 [Kingdonia uniflora]
MARSFGFLISGGGGSDGFINLPNGILLLFQTLVVLSLIIFACISRKDKGRKDKGQKKKKTNEGGSWDCSWCGDCFQLCGGGGDGGGGGG